MFEGRVFLFNMDQQLIFWYKIYRSLVLRIKLKRNNPFYQGRPKPWLVNNSSVGKLTKLENQRNIDDGHIKLYVTTSVMLCGIDLPRVDVIILVRPFSHISSILQAAGRGGRILKDGTRRRVAVYLLYNATDIRSSASNIHENVKSLYQTKSCIKKILFGHFSSENERYDFDDCWCCNFHKT